MSHKGELLFSAFSLLRVEQVTSANEGLRMPPVAVNSVDGSSSVLAVNGHAFVEVLLVNTQVSEQAAGLRFLSLNDLNSVGIDLLNGSDSNFLRLELFVEGPSGGLTPVESTSQVMLSDEILVRFEPKTGHIVLLLV